MVSSDLSRISSLLPYDIRVFVIFFVQKKLGFSNYEAYSEIRLAHQNEIETIQPDMLITVPSQRRVRTLCLSLSFFSITSHKAPQKIFLPSLSFHRVMLLNSAHGDPLDTIQPRLPLINLNSLNHTSKYQGGRNSILLSILLLCI